MKILIIGADGQLGTDLCKVIPKEEQIPLTIKDLDITSYSLTEEMILKYSPEVVINTAAYHRVDDCESADLLAFQVNVFGAKYVAEVCKKINAVLVYLSTDYVFDGTKGSPYLETDAPNPQSAYAISKLAGEQYIKYMLEKYFIVRSSGLYGVAGSLGKGKTNFVENMINKAKNKSELKVVIDEVLTPTYTMDLAGKINELVRTNSFGPYHVTNSGQCSWHEFACKIFELLEMQVAIGEITADQFKTKARRPKYSVLDHAGLKKLGMDDLRPWQEALRAYLIEKGHLPAGRQV